MPGATSQADRISIDEIEALRRETVLFDLVCDNQFPVLEISDPQVVVRSAKQGIRDFILERQVPLFEITNIDISRHDILQIFPFGADSQPLTTIQTDKRAATPVSACSAALRTSPPN